jgi:hypothetical protein
MYSQAISFGTGVWHMITLAKSSLLPTNIDWPNQHIVVVLTFGQAISFGADVFTYSLGQVISPDY